MWKPHTRVTTKICLTCIIRAFQIEFTCIFSVGKLFCSCGASDDASYVCFGETKDKYFNRSLRHGTEMRPRNLRSDSVFWFWYPTLLLNAPKCIYIDAQYSDRCNYFMLWPIIDKWPILKLDKTLKPKIKCLKCYQWDLIFAKDYI